MNDGKQAGVGHFVCTGSPRLAEAHLNLGMRKHKEKGLRLKCLSPHNRGFLVLIWKPPDLAVWSYWLIDLWPSAPGTETVNQEFILIKTFVFSCLAAKLTHLHLLLCACKSISHLRQAGTFPVMDLLHTFLLIRDPGKALGHLKRAEPSENPSQMWAHIYAPS